jgi:hypothetical protein
LNLKKKYNSTRVSNRSVFEAAHGIDMGMTKTGTDIELKRTARTQRPIEWLLWITAVIFIVLGICGIVGTWSFDPSKRLIIEHLIYSSDYFLLNIGFLLLFLALYFLLELKKPKFYERINYQIMIPLVLTIIGICGFLWVMAVVSVPSTDSARLYNTAASLADGDPSIFKDSSYQYYFTLHPYQLGAVALLQVILTLFPDASYLGPQIVNVLALIISYAGLYAIIYRLSHHDKRVLFLTVILSLFSLQPIFFCTFVYGNLCSFACSIWAVYSLIRWLNDGKGIRLSLILLSFAVLFKPNAWIAAIAVAIILLCVMLKRKQWKVIVPLVLCIAMPWSLQHGVQYYYEQISGVSFGSGLSSKVWLAIGMNNSSRAPGWYSEIPAFTEGQTEQNATVEETESAADVIISERLSLFLKDPVYALKFYAQKITSEWEEPTYECFWLSEVRKHGAELPSTAYEIYYGNTNAFLREWMDLSSDACYLFSAIGMAALSLKMRRKRKLKQLDDTALTDSLSWSILPMIVLGGFLYHTIFEAKSQYLLIYYLYLLPIAAYGISVLAQSFVSWVNRLETRNLNK